MKKITSLIFGIALLVSGWQAQAQFIENFDASTTLPPGWLTLNGGDTSSWTINGSPAVTAESGSNVADISYGSTAHDDYLVTPAIAVTANINDQLSFYIRSRSSTYLENYDILLSTTNNTDPAAFTEVLKSNADAPAAWTQLVFDLSPYIGSTVYVAVHATDTNQWNLYADSFVNDGIPTCPAPIDLTVANETATGADISWTLGGSETDWEYVVQAADTGEPTGSGTAVGSTSVAVTNLVADTDYEVYVRASCMPDFSSWVGPVTFTTLISCPVPTAVTAAGVTTTSVDLSWTMGSTESAWDITYGVPSFDPATEGTTFNDTDGTPSETISGLTAATTYDIYVRSVCGSSDLSVYSTKVTFTTSCSTATEFTENFDGVTAPAFPVCWAKVGTSGTANTRTASNNTAPNTFYLFSSSTTNLAVVKMQPVSNVGAGTHRLRFNMRANFTVGGIVEFGYLTNPTDATSFVSLGSATAASTTYTEYIIIPSAGTYTNDIAFRHTGSPANSLLIDDVAWELLPDCPDITNITTTTNVDGSVSLDWDDAAGTIGYNYEIQPQGTAQGTAGALIDSSSLTSDAIVASGVLTNDSSYTLYVQSDCDLGSLGAFKNIDFSYLIPPANDTCATATDLALETSPLTASITDATTATEDISCLQTAGRDLFYKILVPSTNIFSFNQVSNTFDSVHRIAYGASCPGDIELECQDSSETIVTEWTNDTGSDQTVYIIIEGYYDTTRGNFTIQWSVDAPPACPDVTNISVSAALDGSATLDWDDVTTATGYVYEIQPEGIAQGTSGAIASGSPTVSDASIITGTLTQGETYTLYVTSNCGGSMGNYQSIDFTAPIAGASCDGGVVLTPGTPQAGDSTGQQGDFPNAGGAPANPCNSSFNDDEYWFEYTAVTTGELLQLDVTDITATWAGIFVMDNCPSNTPTCVASDTNSGSIADLTITTPALTAGTSYKIVITNFGTPNSTAFTLNSTIIPAPDCPDVLNITTTTNSDATVSLDWDDTAGAGNYNYEVQPQGTAQGTAGALINNNSTTSDAIVASGVLTDGVDYTLYVQSDCGSGMLGNFLSIDFTYNIPPSNIDCANATSITYGQTIEDDSTLSTGTSEGIGCSMGVNGLWYTFVGNGSDVTVASAGDFDLEIAIGSGACGALVNVACEDTYGSGTPDTVTFATTLNEVYYIYIAHYTSGSTTTGELYVTLTGADNVWDGLTWSLGTPTVDHNAIIDAPYDTSIGGDEISFEAGSLMINSTQTLVVGAGDYIDIAGDITVEGDLIVANTASVVQRFDTALTFNEGTTTVEKITPTLAAQSFMILGSPMTDETRDGVYNTAYIVRNHNTANFIPNPDVANDFPVAENFADDNGNNWLNHTGVINPAEGYMVFPQASSTGSGTFTHTYTQGDLNSGEITFPLAYHTDQNSSPNMLANPYASAINADLFYTNPANAGIDVLYFWEHITPLSTSYPGYQPANFSMADISMYSESMGGIPAGNGGVTPTNIISSGQGFAVKAASAGINATFNNDMRITGPNDTYRRPVTSERDRLWINVYNDTYGLGSTTLIGFSENTIDAFEANADIKRLATPVSLYSELATGQELAINALSSFEIETAVGLSFSTQVKESQNYRISLQDIDGINFETVTVYLIDNESGTMTNLSGGDYTFQSEEGTYSERFKVVFQDQILNVSDLALDSVSVYPNPTLNILYIVSPKVAVTGVAIFDIRGRMVTNEVFTSQANYQVDLTTLDSAMYFVEITTENGKVTKRVIKE